MLKGRKKILKGLKQKKKGFTLLEIVVALAIIGIMMIPLGSALVTSVKANKMGEIKQESKLISQEIIEKLRNMGDVVECELTVGNNQGDKIKITEVAHPPTATEEEKKKKNFKVEGTLEDSTGTTMVSGNIKGISPLVENQGSLNYLNEEFGLFIYIQNGEDGKNNKITYWTSDKISSEPKNIDNYLTKATGGVETLDCTNLKIEIGNGTDGNKNKLKINDVDAGLLLPIPAGQPLKVGVYVEGQRADDKLVDLHINNKNSAESDKVEFYFFNNKFHGLNYAIGDPVTDSFKYDRYINGHVNIYDNITYYPKAERLNKGLYTIELEFQKKVPNGTTVTEKTQSEFMVDN